MLFDRQKRIFSAGGIKEKKESAYLSQFYKITVGVANDCVVCGLLRLANIVRGGLKRENRSTN